MHEQDKIDEATYFLSRVNNADVSTIQHEVSAFLTAARSVLQYALKEAKTKNGGQRWYDAAVTADPVVAFLKEERNDNIHERPVHMRTDTSVLMLGSTGVTFTGTLTAVHIDGRTGMRTEVHSEQAIPASPSMPRIVPKTTVSHHYSFRNWNGSEDAPTLCAQYLAELKRIVAEGQNKGFLS